MTYRTLRSWLDRLQATDRLAVARPGVSLDFTLAALAKRWDARKAVLFPEPLGFDGVRHEIPVVAGLVSDRGWIAEAMGVEPGAVLDRFRAAADRPLPWREVTNAACQERIDRNPDLTARSRSRSTMRSTRAPISPPGWSSRAIRRPASRTSRSTASRSRVRSAWAS